MSGQGLAKEIEKRKGEKPSPGTIYPALKQLNSHKLIKEKKEGKSIIYTLTQEGKEHLKVAKQKFCKIFVDII